MPVRLVPVSPGSPIKLDKPVLLVGRNPDCDVVLKTSRKVSRTHCVVACADNRILVRDLGSTNGVWINNHRVEREARLRLGDELSVADVRFHLVKVDKSNGEVETPEAGTPESDAVRPVNVSPDRARPRRSGVQPIEIGDDPVAIPDEEESFMVEASAARLPKVASPKVVEDDASEHNALDLSGDDLPLADSGAALPVLEEESSNDVIPLDISDELRLNESDARSDQSPESKGSSLDEDSGHGIPLIPLDD